MAPPSPAAPPSAAPPASHVEPKPANAGRPFVYRQVKILKHAAAVSKEKKKPSDAVASKRPTIHVCDIIVADDMFAL
jgi:hypothetical protein